MKQSYETIGKCSMCGKKKATTIYRMRSFLKECNEYFCEDCAIKHRTLFIK